MRKFNRCVTMIGCMVTLFATLAGCTTSGLYDEPLEGLTRSLQTPVYAENGQETLSGLCKMAKPCSRRYLRCFNVSLTRKLQG